MEAAKSGRSKCKKCKENIEKGDIRIGGLMEDYGNYSRWNHLNCWRIPERIWSALSDENNADTVLSELLEMDELVLKGLNVFGHSDQVNIIECVRDSTKWTSYSKKKQKDREARLNSQREAMEADDSKPAAVCEPDENEDDRKPAAKQENETESTMNVDESVAKHSSTETNAVSSQDSTNNETHTFEIPIPGKNGCLVDKLKDKVFVISGSFGDLGNGKGRGTTKARAVVESFGGTVRKAISGYTDYLLLGSRANCKIVAKGKEMSNVTLISAISLQKLLLNKIGFESLSLEGITEYDRNECDKENKRPAGDNDEGAKKPAAKRQKTDALVEATSASAIALPKEKKQKFEIPVPGREGAVPNALNGKIFVITGVFPELGGGAGLTLGKNKCTSK